LYWLAYHAQGLPNQTGVWNENSKKKCAQIPQFETLEMTNFSSRGLPILAGRYHPKPFFLAARPG